MAIFELGEKRKPRELLQESDAEVTALKQQIDSREKIIEELDTMVTETKQAEDSLDANYQAIHQHLVQKVRATLSLGLDDYCAYIDAQVELIESRQKKGGGAKSDAPK